MPSSLVSRLGQRNESVEVDTDIATVRQELESANRRYERLVADLAKRGISVEDLDSASPAEVQSPKPAPADNGLAEWEEWDRKFQSLLG